MLGLVVETLVVIVDRDREHLLGVILTDDIVVENFAYPLGSQNAIARLHQRGFILLADDIHAQFDALVAGKHGRTGDELAHLVLALAAERAIERVLGLAASDLAHPALRALPARRGSGTLSLPGPGLRIRSAQPINQPGSTTRLRPRCLAKHGNGPWIKN